MSDLVSCRYLTQYTLEIALIRLYALRNKFLEQWLLAVMYYVKKIIDNVKVLKLDCNECNNFLPSNTTR